MKFSELIGKKVISLFDKAVVGVVISANFNKQKNKLTGFVVEDNREDNLFEEMFLDVKNIYSSNFDAVVIKNNYCLKAIGEKQEFNPLNYEVFTVSGKSLGKVQDIDLDDKFIITALVVEGGKQIAYSSVAGIDNGIIILQDEDKVVDIAKFKHKDKKIKINKVAQQKDEFKAIILPMYDFENAEHTNKEQPEQEEKPKQIKNIAQKNLGISHLLGKTVTQNIIAPNGEVVCRVGGVVTQDVINKANAYSKLRELSFYVK